MIFSEEVTFFCKVCMLRNAFTSLSDNFSQLRAVQFLAWFANIIGESELT